MTIVDGLMLMLLGVLAVPGLIIAKRPDAKRIIDKIAPYQGWIGAILMLYGVYGLIRWFGFFGWLGAGHIFGWLVYTTFVFLMLSLGFMLGIGVIKTFIKDANAQAKMDQLLTRLAPKQGMFGLAALAVGAVVVVLSIVR
jgi:hypothetical protein